MPPATASRTPRFGGVLDVPMEPTLATSNVRRRFEGTRTPRLLRYLQRPSCGGVAVRTSFGDPTRAASTVEGPGPTGLRLAGRDPDPPTVDAARSHSDRSEHAQHLADAARGDSKKASRYRARLQGCLPVGGPTSSIRCARLAGRGAGRTSHATSRN